MLHLLILTSPRDGHMISTWVQSQFLGSSLSPSRVRDIFPLPLVSVGAALQLIGIASVATGGLLQVIEPITPGGKKKGRQRRKKLYLEGTLQIWRCLCVLVLNGMNKNWTYADHPQPSHSPTFLSWFVAKQLITHGKRLLMLCRSGWRSCSLVSLCKAWQGP